MLKRKIQDTIVQYFNSNSNKILIIDGARQIGKSFIIRHEGISRFKNYIEINFWEDHLKDRLFAEARTTNDFYFRLSTIAGEKMGTKADTLVFLDEIQSYPHLLTLLKFLKQEDRFTYIASGSQLGITLKQTDSVPMGSIDIVHMFPLDFEEFLWANGMGEFAISVLHEKFSSLESLDESMHRKMMDFFHKYLLVGGLPDAVNTYLAQKNIVTVRKVQAGIHDLYAVDAAQYDQKRSLIIRRIYEMIPSYMENKKKRIVLKQIEDKKGKRSSDYLDEFDYLIHSGIALDVKAISNPVFPLIESSGKNLLKLYLNDVGILTDILYKNNISAVMDDQKSVNLGSVYETVVASELKAHGHNLFYYDNKQKGEVDFLTDDYSSLSVIPIEVKSGKDYSIHSALNKFVKNDDYSVLKAYVLSNVKDISVKGKIIYAPIYNVMFL